MMHDERFFKISYDATILCLQLVEGLACAQLQIDEEARLGRGFRAPHADAVRVHTVRVDARLPSLVLDVVRKVRTEAESVHAVERAAIDLIVAALFVHLLPFPEQCQLLL
jgi:hypothetical protein